MRPGYSKVLKLGYSKVLNPQVPCHRAQPYYFLLAGTMPPSATFRPSRRACPPPSRTCTRSGSWAPRCGPSTKLPPVLCRPTRSSPSAPGTRRSEGVGRRRGRLREGKGSHFMVQGRQDCAARDSTYLSGKEGRLRAKGAEDPEKIILKCDTFQKKINYGSLKSECLVVCMPHNGRVGSCLSSRVLYTFISMINSKASAPWHNLWALATRGRRDARRPAGTRLQPSGLLWSGDLEAEDLERRLTCITPFSIALACLPVALLGGLLRLISRRLPAHARHRLRARRYHEMARHQVSRPFG
eukprot:scaffold3711_cov65-Phaeocystis_antarctica.AAC.4